jgi:hypothetical protein
MTLKRGLVTRTAMDESVAERLQATLPLLASEVWPGAPGDEMFQNLASLYESVHNDRLSVELCAAVFFYATVYDAFARCTGAMARDIRQKNRVPKMADRLAAVRGLLAVSPTAAIEELNRLRQTLKLPLLLPSQDSAPSADINAVHVI